jgi:molecular chaperone IbpA
MRSFDLTPLYSSTVGFDRVFSLLRERSNAEGAYPPYNIEKLDDHSYRISLAVAGFAEDELKIESKENTLTVQGVKAANDDTAESSPKTEFLFQGIAARAFERRFQLADYVSVAGARLENGLLHIDLVREVPEAAKPKLIPIGTAKPRVLDITQEKAAA